MNDVLSIPAAPGSATASPHPTPTPLPLPAAHLDAADETQQQRDENDLPLKVLHGGGDGSDNRLGKEDWPSGF